MVFGHKKCSGRYRVHIGSPEGVPGTPSKDMGLMGQEGKRSSQQGLLRPPYGPHQRRKEKGKREGSGGIRPYWALVERRQGPQGEAARPHGLVRIGLGVQPTFPCSSPPLSFSPSFPSRTRKGESYSY